MTAEQWLADLEANPWVWVVTFKRAENQKCLKN